MREGRFVIGLDDDSLGFEQSYFRTICRRKAPEGLELTSNSFECLTQKENTTGRGKAFLPVLMISDNYVSSSGETKGYVMSEGEGEETTITVVAGWFWEVKERWE